MSPTRALIPAGADTSPARKLSEELALLHDRSREHPLSIRFVIIALGSRAYSLLLILLALPFCTPIPLPGLSTPFGVALALIALQMVLGKRPWLPQKIQQRELSSDFFERMIRVAGRIIRIFEKMLRPRLPWLTEFAWQRQLHSSVMLLSALILMLPLFIPLTNFFPACVIVLMAGGLLERDGYFVITAHIVFAAGIAYFFLLGEAATQIIEQLTQWLAG